ncbi:MAG: ABC transporter ATP-binding protein [Bacteroidota bacterium]
MVQWTILGPFFRRHPAKVVSLCLVGILSSMSAIFLPVSIGKFYTLMFDGGGKRSAFLDFLPAGFFDTVPHFLLFFSSLIGVNMLLGYGKRYGVAAIGTLLTYELRNQLFAHQLKLQTRIYEEKGVGKYLLRYSGDLKSIHNYLTRGVIGFGVDILMLILSMWVLYTISPTLTGISIVAILLMVLPLSALNRRLQGISERRRNQKSGLLAFVSQRLQAIVTIKAFNRETPEREKFLRRSTRNFQTDLSFHRLSSLNYVLVPGLLYAMMAVIMGVIYWQQRRGVQIDQAALLSAFLLLITILPVLRRCLRIMITWKLGLISMRKLQGVLELPTEDAHQKDELMLSEGDIQLEEVSFSVGGQKILDKIEARWHHHGLHLVTGGTGAGKSLLVKMLLGIQADYQGRILVDEQDVRQGELKSLRKLVTVISEDYPLLGKTVFEAISYSRKASKRKGASLLLNKVQQDLPEAAKLELDDRIGSQGVGLSKGQERILLFTRALLTRKPILLLDEPFSSIEPHIEAHLLKLIRRLRKKRTIILFLKQNDYPDLRFDSRTDLDQGSALAESSVVKKLRA